MSVLTQPSLSENKKKIQRTQSRYHGRTQRKERTKCCSLSLWPDNHLFYLESLKTGGLSYRAPDGTPSMLCCHYKTTAVKRNWKHERSVFEKKKNEEIDSFIHKLKNTNIGSAAVHPLTHLLVLNKQLNLWREVKPEKKKQPWTLLHLLSTSNEALLRLRPAVMDSFMLRRFSTGGRRKQIF